MNRTISVILVVCLLSGCFPSFEQTTTPLDSRAVNVEILPQAPGPEMNCKNLGAISGRKIDISSADLMFGTTQLESTAGAQNRIRNQAAALGANRAVMLGEADGVAYLCP